MSLQTLSEWLRCPVCFFALAPHEPLALVCPSGHSFDVNKRGYVTLLRSQGLIGDSTAMLDARDTFLNAGWYSPLRHAVTSAVASKSPHSIVDIGCGTGYYLGGVLELAPDARALAVDLSPAAVSRTVRALSRTDGLVADVWSPLPIQDAAADVVLNVFAPRNAPEFARVLRPDGLLVVVIPQSSHLRELRDLGLALGVQEDKATVLIDSLAPYFAVDSRQQLVDELRLTPDEIRALVGMGPSAHHQRAGADLLDASEQHRVTTAFEVLGFRRLPR
jgi:SAM-dependent methyltransferase